MNPATASSRNSGPLVGICRYPASHRRRWMYPIPASSAAQPRRSSSAAARRPGPAAVAVGSSLAQAGRLPVAVAADPGAVGVDDARSGAAAEPDPLGGGVLVGRRRVLGAQQPEPDRGPALPPLVALPGGGVEVELER